MTDGATPRTTPARYRFVRQSVTLDGAGNQDFDDGKKARELIHKLFDRYFEENSLEPLCDTETMEISNRYLTPKRDAPTDRHIGFDSLVDPKGILEGMAKEGDGFVHTEDNVVMFWQRKTNAEGKHM